MRAMRQAMRIMGHQFVMGRTIDEALERSLRGENARYRYSFDMLGEAALTAPDAERYLAAYRAAIETVGTRSRRALPMEAAASISVKLSALHPRYERTQPRQRARRARPAADRARPRGARRGHGAHRRCGGERAARAVARAGRGRLPRAGARTAGTASVSPCRRIRSARAAVLDWLGRSPRATRRRLNVRLVKGAYWDSEIKRAQERGLRRLTRCSRARCNTDVSYLACARRLLERRRVDLSAVRDAQRAHRRLRRRSSAASSIAASSSSACTAWARSSTRRSSDATGLDRAVPRLCAGRRARGPAAVPRAAAARERRQHVVRQSHRRRAAARRRDRCATRSTRSTRCRGVAHPRIPSPRRCSAQERVNSRGRQSRGRCGRWRRSRAT